MGTKNYICSCIEKVGQGSMIVDNNDDNKENMIDKLNEKKEYDSNKTNLPLIKNNMINQLMKIESERNKKEKKKISEASTEGINNKVNNIDNNDNLNKINNNIDNNNENKIEEKDLIKNKIVNSKNKTNNENNSKNSLEKKNTDISNNSLKKTIKPKNYKKILIYGDKETGKTSFVLKICNNKFDIFYIPSLAEEKTIKTLILNSKKFEIEFIVSNEISCIKEADLYLIFFDLTSYTSYLNAKNLIVEKIYKLNKYIFIIGNKNDLRNKINISDLNDFCNKYNCQNLLISIKDSIGVSLLLKKFGEIFDYEL